MGGGSSSGATKKKFTNCYMLSSELGKGAFSIVKLGINKSTGERTAVKIIKKKELSEEDLNSLKDEISILGSIDHKNIIKLLETFDEGSELYMVTELVEGGEMFDRIVSKSTYTEKEARDVVKVILETIAFLHQSDIVHRDLKPENLLLMGDSDTAIKLADFGFSKKISALVDKEVACGTPGYVAPEILRGDKYGGEVDIWSIGVITYILLAGYPPFYDDDQKRLFRKIKEGRYYFHEEHWGNASPESMDIIRCMLCVSQKERWTAQQLMSHPWILQSDAVLENKNLKGAIITMKKFNARRRLKAAAEAIIMTNRMKKLLSSIRMSAKDAASTIRLNDAKDALLDETIDLSKDEREFSPLWEQSTEEQNSSPDLTKIAK